MKINPEKRFFKNDIHAIDFVKILEENQSGLSLDDSEVYYNYPLFRDIEGDLIRTHVLIISPNHGVCVIGITNATDLTAKNDLKLADNSLGNAFNQIYSRLIKNKNLKVGKRELSFNVESFIYAPSITKELEEFDLDLEASVVKNTRQIIEFFNSQSGKRIDEKIMESISSSIDGALGMVRAKLRDDSLLSPGSKGKIANQIESEILTFDRKQKHGYILPLDGIERIRGLAGSGKTIVLAMKVALTHLEYPESTILFTFSTKSLYQHIQRLIIRFYKQFSEFEPDFEKIKILHAWGGSSLPGVYYETCIAHGKRPITFQDAKNKSVEPFDYVCKDFLEQTKKINPQYDYVFIDEGQDFPVSFIKICAQISRGTKVVLAYDELQTIFQPIAPSYEQLFGERQPNTEDVVLYKCYRNPREIIVCAIALGFGLYSPIKIFQMLENQEHWEDVGFKVHEGNFTEGSQIVIERPIENSRRTISDSFDKANIVFAEAFESFDDEVDFVINKITENLKDGLRPDDILVEVVDDRNAKLYLDKIADRLQEINIQTHNVHSDGFGLKDFNKDGCITLSTVHKAKGNESFMVFVVGVDALFGKLAGVKARNMLFTAMTRAKGWVCITGIGELAEKCKFEVNQAMQNFPYLKFLYPSPDALRIMKRDLQEKDIKKQKFDRMLDEISNELSPQEIKEYLDSKTKSKKSK